MCKTNFICVYAHLQTNGNVSPITSQDTRDSVICTLSCRVKHGEILQPVSQAHQSYSIIAALTYCRGEQERQNKQAVHITEHFWCCLLFFSNKPFGQPTHENIWFCYSIQF